MPSRSTARQSQCFLPQIVMLTLSKCHLSSERSVATKAIFFRLVANGLMADISAASSKYFLNVGSEEIGNRIRQSA